MSSTELAYVASNKPYLITQSSRQNTVQDLTSIKKNSQILRSWFWNEVFYTSHTEFFIEELELEILLFLESDGDFLLTREEEFGS